MTNRLRTVSACMGSILLYIAGCGGTREGREVHIAAAANLQVVVKEIDRAFEAKTEIRVVPTLGATAQLTQQIENGAPIDVFLAADTQHVDQLIARQLADRQTRAIYARGQLVLWAPSQPELTRLADLASPRIR